MTRRELVARLDGRMVGGESKLRVEIDGSTGWISVEPLPGVAMLIDPKGKASLATGGPGDRVVTTRIDWWLAAHCQLAYMPAGARHETARDDITWVRDLYDEAEGLRKSREETAALLAKVEAEREAATADAFKHASDSLLPDWAERRLI